LSVKSSPLAVKDLHVPQQTAWMTESDTLLPACARTGLALLGYGPRWLEHGSCDSFAGEPSR
jgi:hypothetical protein